MKALWLPNYERAIQIYRHAKKSNQRLIELSDADDNLEAKKTKTPREIDTKKLTPYLEIIEYIDAIAYESSISIDEKIYELEETKSIRAGSYETGKSGLSDTAYNETNRFLERAIHDVKSLIDERIEVSAKKLSVSLVRGEISKQKALNEVRAKLTEIDFAIEDQIQKDFVERGKNNLSMITDLLMGKTSPWYWYESKEPNTELSEIIREAGYSTSEVMGLCELEKTIERLIQEDKENTKKEKARAPYRQLPEISAWMQSNTETESMTYKEFCENYLTNDGGEINPGSLRTAWSGQGQYGESGQEIKRRWDEQKNSTISGR